MTDRPLLNLRLEQRSFAPDEHSPQLFAGNQLASICFTRQHVGEAAASNSTIVRVPMAALDAGGASGTASEDWDADAAFTRGTQQRLRYAHSDEILFGVIQLTEAEFEADPIRSEGKTALQLATEYAYLEIFKLLDVLNFNHILRFWNYLADINGHSNGIERYRQFNSGRQDGFLVAGRQVAGSVPAASALGFAEGPLTIYFFAARDATPIAIENPRQISAYQYPEAYGPRSPTFSRGSVVRLGGNSLFFLSGTASIVGHQTLHAGDVLAQTRETVANIKAVVAEANRVAPEGRFTIGDLCYKVYVRHAKDVRAVREELRCSLGSTARMTFLNAEICRKDLLMEVEATGGHAMETCSACSA